jgi:hypothetical protein
VQPSDWLASYRAGACAEVWSAMTELGPDVRDPDLLGCAETVAAETMSRVRTNVELLVERLGAAGYELERPEEAHVPPRAALAEQIDALETRVGALPLSLRSFYEVVGTVDLTQSSGQLVQWHLPERSAASELQLLGEYNPLVVEALDPSDTTPGWFYFASDEHHKANYSGGEHYHVALPDPGADFRIQGLYGVDEAGELFVSYLRATFECGGFRGTVGGDEERSWTIPPDLELTRTLAAGLQPI